MVSLGGDKTSSRQPCQTYVCFPKKLTPLRSSFEEAGQWQFCVLHPGRTGGVLTNTQVNNFTSFSFLIDLIKLEWIQRLSDYMYQTDDVLSCDRGEKYGSETLRKVHPLMTCT